MTNLQYRKALERLGLGIMEAGPILGISTRQSRRLASGEQGITVTIQRLLWFLERHGIPPQWRPQKE